MDASSSSNEAADLNSNQMDVSADVSPATADAANAAAAKSTSPPKDVFVPKDFYAERVGESSGVVYFHNPLANDDKKAKKLSKAEFEARVSTLYAERVIDRKTGIFLDSSFVESILPPSSLTLTNRDDEVEQWELVHFFLTVKNNTLYAYPSNSSAASSPKKRKSTSTSTAAAAATVVAVDEDVSAVVASATDANNNAMDVSDTAPMVSHPPASNARGSVNPKSAALSSSMSRYNGPFGFIHNTIIGLYMHPEEKSSTVAEHVLSYYGDNIIDIAHGKSMTRTILDHISIFWFSPCRLLVLPSSPVAVDSAGADSADVPAEASVPGAFTVPSFSGWATTTIEDPDINIAHATRVPSGCRTGVLKMYSWLQRHPTPAQARNMLRYWRMYCDDKISLATWTEHQVVDGYLNSWPQPASARYEAIDFHAVNKLLKTETEKRNAWAQATNGGGNKRKRASTDDNAAAVVDAADGKKRRSRKGASDAAAVKSVSTKSTFSKTSRLHRKRTTRPGDHKDIKKPQRISDELIAFIKHAGFESSLVDGDKIPRPDVHKIMWNYIKAKSLQKPDEKNFVMIDDVLRPIYQIPAGERTDIVEQFNASKYIQWNFIPDPNAVPSARKKRRGNKGTPIVDEETPVAPAVVNEIALGFGEITAPV